MAALPRSNTRVSSASIFVSGILCLGLLAGGCAMGNKDDQDSQAALKQLEAAAGLAPLDRPSPAPVPYMDPISQTNMTNEVLRAQWKIYEENQQTIQMMNETNQRVADGWMRVLSGQHDLGYVHVVP